MFENVGAKVKGIIKFFFWLSFIVECIAAIVGIVSVYRIFSGWDNGKCALFIFLILIGLGLFFLGTYVIALFEMCLAQITLDVEKLSKCICDGENASANKKPDKTIDPAFIVNNADTDKKDVPTENNKNEDDIPKELKF